MCEHGTEILFITILILIVVDSNSLLLTNGCFSGHHFHQGSAHKPVNLMSFILVNQTKTMKMHANCIEMSH